jgi:hypothetical protein
MKDNNPTLIAQDGDMSQVSMKNGFWFYFEYEGNDISVHGSAWSGKEVVYVNNHPVSIKRNIFSRQSTHHFSVAGKPARIEYHLVKLLTGELSVSLYVDDVLIVNESKAYRPKKASGPKAIAIIVLSAMAGGLFGYGLVTLIFSLMR